MPLQNIKLSFKCPKQLNELQPCNGDWYCDGCHKIVHDFRGMSEAQILDAFAKGGYKMCGIFEAGRIDVQPQRNKWLRWASAAMLFLGITALHQRMYAQVHKATKSSTVKKVSKHKRKHAITYKQIITGDMAVTIDTTDHHYGYPLVELVVERPIPTPDSSNTVFTAVEFSPEFDGGEAAREKYFREHIRYSGEFEGKVYAQFVVEKDGSLTDIKILRGGNEQAMEEAIKVVKAMPKWKPGIKNGKAVRVLYTLPVNFSR